MPKSSRKLSRESQRTRQRSAPRSGGWWIAGLIGAIAVISLIFVVYLPSRPVEVLDGVLTYPNQPRDHSELPQTYAQTPPVGGVHSSAWQNCGVYAAPVRNENAVHSRSHVLGAPYPDLPKPVIASAWGVQLLLDDVNDQRLSLFVSRYEQGPQTPERGAICTGGVGTPLS